MEKFKTSAEKLLRYQNMEKFKTSADKPLRDQIMENLKISAEKPLHDQNVEKSKTSAEKPLHDQIMEKSKTSAENPLRDQIMEKSKTSAEKPLRDQNVEKSKTSAEKAARRFAEIQSQLLAIQEVLSVNGCVQSYSKKYRGERLGPYYRVVFRDGNRRRSIYLGNSPPLAQRIKDLLEAWQLGHREKLYLRRLRAEIRASLRQEKANLEKLLAPLGYRMKGYAFHRVKQRELITP